MHSTTTRKRSPCPHCVRLAGLRSTYAGSRVDAFFLAFQKVRLHLPFALCDNFLLPWDQPALFSLQNQSVGCRLRRLDPSWNPSTFHSRSRVHRIYIVKPSRKWWVRQERPQTRWIMQCLALTSKELKSTLFAPEYTRCYFPRVHA